MLEKDIRTDVGDAASAQPSSSHAAAVAASYPNAESTPAVTPKRAYRAANFRNTIGFLAVLASAYLLFETLIFRSGFYTRYLEPDSAAGVVERAIYNESHRASSGKKEVLVVGNSRMVEGFSAKQANEHKPEDGFLFVNFGVSGSGDRVWYYLVRAIDPHRDRYTAITIPIDDYSDFDDYEDVADRVSEVSLLVNRLGVMDIWPYTMSFTSWKSRYEVFRRLTFKGLEYQRDVQDFLEHPRRRLERVADYRENDAQRFYDYGGMDHSLAGMQVDWEHEKITFPSSIPQDRQNFLRPFFFNYPPQMGRNRAFEVRWLGALVDLYRGSKTKIIIFQAPRGPSPRPKPLAHLPWTITDDLLKRPWVRVVDGHTFDLLERPELFGDHVHLDAEGRKLFSPMLADVVKQSLR